MNLHKCAKIVLLFTCLTLCLLNYVIHRYSGFFRGYESSLISLQWLVLLSLNLWVCTFIFLTFVWKDALLIALVFIATIFFYFGQVTSSMAQAVTFLVGVSLGKGTQFLLKSGKWKTENGNFLLGVAALLAFSAWWHLDMSDNYYHGPRWMGLWDNPNLYGSLMGAGLVLAVGLLVARQKLGAGSQKLPAIILFIAAGMMAVGLLFSYSRGSWAGTVTGLIYLAWSYRKLKWQFVLPVILVVTSVAWFFWNATADDAPWYVKRLDLGRPSAQHRASAWRGALEIMRDHPLGVGWDNAVITYEKNYSPPEDGAGALNTNDYLMLGTQLGIVGLFCFVAYVSLCLRIKCRIQNEEGRIQAACRAGALVLLVAFWFDGGLFKLPTAAVFWILLELGSVKAVDSATLMADVDKATQMA